MGKKRKDVKYPNLDVRYNTKKRRYYMDNHYYANRLPEDAKKYLNDFNGEYYNASFSSNYDYSDIHVCQVDAETVTDLKAQIRHIKALRKKIWSKSPNTTTDADRDLSAHYTEQIEEMEEFLNRVHPRRELEKANNDRNNDFINCVRASNEVDLVSWETLDDNMLGDLGPEWEDEE